MTQKLFLLQGDTKWNVTIFWNLILFVGSCSFISKHRLCSKSVATMCVLFRRQCSLAERYPTQPRWELPNASYCLWALSVWTRSSNANGGLGSSPRLMERVSRAVTLGTGPSLVHIPGLGILTFCFNNRSFYNTTVLYQCDCVMPRIQRSFLNTESCSKVDKNVSATM